ncbi:MULTISPECIES: DUF3352 domain-containing protein [Cyanophyceae]|uniref:DUF3352 domain-containing protein n=1 Tax=unclassified Leptolyngbya TaxID=2650499 RepID=UPI001688EE41|nr:MULTISPECIES: DUF3352 domain-containing protein [Cyanophyceae]MBD1916712.1 DUF3352 domain-containing protein [Phormidium sp. FACHB-77]MBD2029342.1 DUF3352 domain-containing protein [Phormidium sp. FACHB-322]MBD2051917.1 DUF3352 domain-containing protein [Leptolyngbya sp. FACHB-60]
MGTGNRGLGGNKWAKWSRIFPAGQKLTLGLIGSTLAVSTMPPSTTHAAETESWHHLPTNTALVMLIDTTADTWEQLSQYQLFKLLDEEQGLAPALPGLPYLPYGIDFASEVAPWIGDTAVVALLPVQPGKTATIAEASIMVAPVADAEAFAAFRDTFFELQGEAPEVTSTLGTEIYFWPTPETEDWSEPALPEACSPAEVDTDACIWDNEANPEAIDGSSSEAGEAELAPLKASPTPQILRFNGAVGLPLTVSPFHEEEEPFEVEVPMPLPEFGPSGLAVAFLPDALITAEDPAALEQYSNPWIDSVSQRRLGQRLGERVGRIESVFASGFSEQTIDVQSGSNPGSKAADIRDDSPPDESMLQCVHLCETRRCHR